MSRHVHLGTLYFLLAVVCCGGIARAETDKEAEPGLVAQYFSLPKVENFDDVKPGAKPTLVRVDKQVNFESVDGEFYGTHLKDNFIAQWSGVLRVEKAGNYTISTSSDDGSRVYIDEKLIIENGGIHAMNDKGGPAELSAGDHAIRIEYYQVAGGAGCKVLWQVQDGEKEPIPASAFFHKKGSAEISYDKVAWEKLTLAKPATSAGPKPRKKMDKLAAEMDYGPFLDLTLGANLTKNIAYKGVMVKVNKEKNANICFDTELLRVSSAWAGNGLSLAGRQFADDSNDYSIVEGPLQFTTNVRPGWAKEELRDDPRGSADANAPKDGPLPADWAKYKGLYLDGENVVFSYTVGAVPVLEEYGSVLQGESLAYTRTLNVGASPKPLTLLVCELEPAGLDSAGVSPVGAAPGTAKNGPADKNVAVLANKEDATVSGVLGAPAGSEWEVVEGRVYLKLPKLDGPTALKLVTAKVPVADVVKFGAFLSGTPENLLDHTKGGPARWKETVTTKGEVSTVTDAPYVVDTLTAPYINPYKSWLRLTGIDFFKDGRAAVCTWNGDVWIVSGIDDKLENLTWKRYATGLSGPMGVKIVDDLVYVTGRDQITRLHDLNNDGEADFYECFNNNTYLTTNFHEYCFDLQTDKEGNFYFTKGSAIWAGSLRMSDHAGSFIKLSKDGTKFEILANGFRAPNGCAVGPNGELTCSDNQGNWTPECPINFIRKGAYYGWVGAGQAAKPDREKPLCWLPYNFDKSTSGQVWVDSDKWGPLKGQMMALSYANVMTHIIWEKNGDDVQGGVVKFLQGFPSGIMRGRFSPVDGQLYVAGLRGWSSNTSSKDCILQRIRYTGKPAYMIQTATSTKTGFDVTFTEPLDPASVADLESYNCEWFNVVRSGNYGSGEMNVSDATKKGREVLPVKSAKLSADGKTVSLEVPGLKPVTNIVIKFKLKAADGAAVKQEMGYTINKVRE